VEPNPLLDTYLHQLRLPTFVKNYSQFAADAARSGQDHVRFLLALVEQEIAQRERNLLQKRIKAARFPMLKELADFDFSAVPLLNKAQVLDYARGDYIRQRESIIFIGNPGLGKPQPIYSPNRYDICS
jgi:DNA replication protein DnaC